MAIIVKNVLVRTHHFIGLVEYYHGSLSQIYIITTSKISKIKLEFTLQIFFKTLNDLIRFNGLVLPLLIFSVYFHMTDINVLSPTIN